MRQIKTFDDFKKSFNDFDNDYIDSIRLVYALSELNKTLGDNNDIVDDEFIMRIAANNSGVSWLYNPKKRSVIDSNLNCEESYNSEILMDDVPGILKEFYERAR